MLGPSISENDPPVFAPWVTSMGKKLTLHFGKILTSEHGCAKPITQQMKTLGQDHS